MHKLKKQELKKALAYAHIVSGLALNGHADFEKSFAAIKKKLLEADNQLFR